MIMYMVAGWNTVTRNGSVSGNQVDGGTCASVLVSVSNRSTTDEGKALPRVFDVRWPLPGANASGRQEPWFVTSESI